MNIPIEYFGTAASVVVAISLTQKNIKRLRILNLVGAAAFAVYGFMIKSWPVLGLNAFISVIDVYYLIEMNGLKNYFELLKIDKPSESVYLKKFMEFYIEDIGNFIPDFNPEIEDGFEAVFILRDVLPVSMVLYRMENERVEIIVDYAIPAYRDMKNARFFFDKIAETFSGKSATFFTKPGNKLHNKYLQKIGFKYRESERMYIYE